MRGVYAAMLVAACVACSAPAPAPGPAGPVLRPTGSNAAPSPSAEARARQIVDAQLAAASSASQVPNHVDTDVLDRALRATFTPDAVVCGDDGDRPAAALPATLFRDLEIASLAAVGDDEIVAFVVTFHDLAPQGERNPASSASWYPARYVGVAARSAGWKVVAASIEITVHASTAGTAAVAPDDAPFPNATAATGPTALALDGAALARGATARTLVIDRDRPVGYGVGALGAWTSRTLVLDPDGREVVAPAWATVQANTVFSAGAAPSEHGVVEILVAERRTSAGAWRPILVEYMGR